MTRFAFGLFAALVVAALFPVDMHAAALGARMIVENHHAIPDWLTSAPVLFGTSAIATQGAMTLLDWAKNRDPNDRIARVIELLAQKNELLLDMPFMEGNLVTGHLTTVRTGLPVPTWTKINQGVVPTNSQEAQITEHVGHLEDYSLCDTRLARIGGDEKGLRLSKGKAHLEGMNQEMASTFFYGSNIAAEEFVGLSPRYSSLSAGNADHIITGGGTSSTDNASIWLIDWSEESISGIYPKGSTAGLQHQDKGTIMLQNAGGVTGALMEAFIDHWEWSAGLALMDWRGAVRIANIDVSNLSSASDAADLIYMMEDAEERIPFNFGKRAWYMNRTMKRFLRHQARTSVSNGGGITWETVGGKRMGFFGETPIRTCDALLNTEDAVV